MFHLKHCTTPASISPYLTHPWSLFLTFPIYCRDLFYFFLRWKWTLGHVIFQGMKEEKEKKVNWISKEREDRKKDDFFFSFTLKSSSHINCNSSFWTDHWWNTSVAPSSLCTSQMAMWHMHATIWPLFYEPHMQKEIDMLWFRVKNNLWSNISYCSSQWNDIFALCNFFPQIEVRLLKCLCFIIVQLAQGR